MGEDTIRLLIEQKITFVNTTANACMLWWVSSIVFYGSVLAAMWLKQDEMKAWLKQDELKRKKGMNQLGIVLSGFFLATALFGVVIIGYSFPVQREIADLAARLKYEGNFFGYEMWGFRVAMAFGIGSFLLVFFIWNRFWHHLYQQPKEEAPQLELESGKSDQSAS